jgi:pheromone shutdown protein TraB
VRGEARIEVPGCQFVVLGTVRGLVSEAARVEAAFERVQPDIVALGVGPEDLAGLEQHAKGAEYEHDYSESDEVYAHFLAQFGPVELPPRDLALAVELAARRGVPLVAIDLPEVAYVEAFTREVSGWQLLMYNRRVRKLAKRPPAAEDAMDFHLAWDRAIGRLKGFATLEREREEHMARNLAEDARFRGKVLVLVEGARVEGLVHKLMTLMHAPILQ